MNYEIVPYKKREHSIVLVCSMSKLSQMIYVPQEPVHSTKKVVRISFKLRKRFELKNTWMIEIDIDWSIIKNAKLRIEKTWSSSSLAGDAMVLGEDWGRRRTQNGFYCLLFKIKIFLFIIISNNCSKEAPRETWTTQPWETRMLITSAQNPMVNNKNCGQAITAKLMRSMVL